MSPRRRALVAGVSAAGLALLAAGCATTVKAQVSDEALVVNKLLDLPDPAFAAPGAYDALGELRAWEALYGARLAGATGETRADAELRRYLLVGFVAWARTDAGIKQAATSDLMPLYERRRDDVLRVLGELPFLAPSTCYYLGAYFGFEDRNREGKDRFWEDNRAGLDRALGPSGLAGCGDAFRGARRGP